MTTKEKAAAAESAIETTEEVISGARGERKARPERRKVYNRVRESEIPDELQALFTKDGYELKFVRWCIRGEEDYRYLARRENEGYEFVMADELPASYLKQIRVRDTGTCKGMVTIGDLCLMKVDSDLRDSRRKFYQGETDVQVAAVDIHVLTKKGFKDLGTKSKVMLKEPSFQD